jgi:hypothetical protein
VQAKEYPLFNILQPTAEMYSLKTFNHNDEFPDELRRLCDIRPLFCVFQVIDKNIDILINQTTKEMTSLMGKKTLADLDEITRPEVSHIMFNFK